MKREVYESQKPFAGKKKPSMQRRLIDHDYTIRSMYMVTMVVEGRRPLLGHIAGSIAALDGNSDAPRLEPSELGRQVAICWQEIATRNPQISLIALQLMPDHLHGILFVREKLDKPLGKVLLGFKQGCNKAYRSLFPSAVKPVAVVQQPTKTDRYHGLLFAPGFNDQVLLHQGQLQRWIDYLRDNPRRLLMKRARPEWLHPFFQFSMGSQTYSGIGNRELLNAPYRLNVRISRRLSEQQLQAEIIRYLSAAEQGAVLISPAISPGEKQVMRMAFDRHFPTIVIMENGFAPLSKPHGEQFYACSEGRLLMLSPWEHHNERKPLTAYQCQQMNLMALELSGIV